MPASRERFERAFGLGHAVLPVVHVVESGQARRNVLRSFEAGANGVFLMNHALGSTELLAIHEEVAESWPGDGWE